MGYLVGKGLYIVAAAPWIHLLGNESLLLDVYLCITCDTCREVGGQSDSLVKRIGMQRLCMTKSGTHGLDTCTAYIVERILLGK